MPSADAHGLVGPVRDARILGDQDEDGLVGRPSRTGGSVERDEAIGAVDEVGQHDQAAVRDAVGVAQRQIRRFWQP